MADDRRESRKSLPETHWTVYDPFMDCDLRHPMPTIPRIPQS